MTLRSGHSDLASTIGPWVLLPKLLRAHLTQVPVQNQEPIRGAAVQMPLHVQEPERVCAAPVGLTLSATGPTR